jgi:hypothetical protein
MMPYMRGEKSAETVCCQTKVTASKQVLSDMEMYRQRGSAFALEASRANS